MIFEMWLIRFRGCIIRFTVKDLMQIVGKVNWNSMYYVIRMYSFVRLSNTSKYIFLEFQAQMLKLWVENVFSDSPINTFNFLSIM